MSEPITLNKLGSKQAQAKALGGLYDPAYEWPVVYDTVLDVRLLARKDMLGFDPSKDDPLRPAARKLSDAIASGQSGVVFGVIAVSGSGKTSCAFDLAREHWTIYVNASENNKYTTLGPRWTEKDPLFTQLLLESQRFIGGDRSLESQLKAWELAVTRCTVDLLARLVTLLRVARTEGQTPWDFLVHQVVGEQAFARDRVKQLKSFDADSYDLIADAVIDKLQPFLSKSRLVLVIDEIQSAAVINLGHYVRERLPADQQARDKGLLSPLANAAETVLKPWTGWSVVFMGTGASEDRVEHGLSSSVGKQRGAFNIIAQADFPMATAREVKGVLGRLNLHAAGLGDLFATDLDPARPITEPARNIPDPCVESIRAMLEDYVVGGRFRLLAGVIEALKVEPGAVNLLRLVHEAVDFSILNHRETLESLLRLRTGPRPKYPSGITVDYLESVYLAAAMTGGEARFPQNAGGVDLIELGIACEARRETNEDVSTSFSVQAVKERFVLDVLKRLFEDERWASAAMVERCRRLTGVLQRLMEELGPATAGKGNLVEGIVLQRVAAAGLKHASVAALPFVEPFLPSAEAKSTREWARAARLRTWMEVSRLR